MRFLARAMKSMKTMRSAMIALVLILLLAQESFGGASLDPGALTAYRPARAAPRTASLRPNQGLLDPELKIRVLAAVLQIEELLKMNHLQ